jgi:hypothetical protein
VSEPEAEKAVPVVTTGQASAEGATTAARQFFRFLVGLAVVAPERLQAALKLVDEVDAPQAPLPPVSIRHVLIGALSGVPARLAHVYADLDPVARRWGGRAMRFLPKRLVGDRVHELTKWLAVRAVEWAEIGRREEVAGRRLVEVGLNVLPEAVFSAIAESPELRQLISQETAGLTRTAIEKLRRTSARADDTSESIARRVLRGRRGQPQGG